MRNQFDPIDHEYHPPSQEYPRSQEFAPLGDEYNADATDPPRRIRKRRWTACTVTAAVALTLLVGAAASDVISAPPSSATKPPVVSPPVQVQETEEPVGLLLTLTEAVERYSDWYDESRGIWLHFEGDEGWFFDGQFFHRFAWLATGDTSGISTMAYQDVGSGYKTVGSAPVPEEYPMTLRPYSGGCRLEMVSGMGQWSFSSSSAGGTTNLAADSFVPLEGPPPDGAGMEGVLGKTTEELLAGIGSFTVVDRAEKPYGETGGLQGAFPAAMTGLRLNADGSGTVFYHDGSVASLHWSVAQAYGALAQIGCDELYLSDGVQYMFTAFGELTLTEEGPRLWIYNSFADEETCFAPESNIGE